MGYFRNNYREFSAKEKPLKLETFSRVCAQIWLSAPDPNNPTGPCYRQLPVLADKFSFHIKLKIFCRRLLLSHFTYWKKYRHSTVFKPLSTQKIYRGFSFGFATVLGLGDCIHLSLPTTRIRNEILLLFQYYYLLKALFGPQNLQILNLNHLKLYVFTSFDLLLSLYRKFCQKWSSNYLWFETNCELWNKQIKLLTKSTCFCSLFNLKNLHYSIYRNGT